MSENEAGKALKRLQEIADKIIRDGEATRRILVNKKTHRIRFEGETEDEVTIVIENRKQKASD